jgi:hypothetical protein
MAKPNIPYTTSDAENEAERAAMRRRGDALVDAGGNPKVRNRELLDQVERISGHGLSKAIK